MEIGAKVVIEKRNFDFTNSESVEYFNSTKRAIFFVEDELKALKERDKEISVEWITKRQCKVKTNGCCIKYTIISF